MLAPQLWPTLWGPTYCSLPGSSVDGILQAKFWSGLPFPSPGDLPDPGIQWEVGGRGRLRVGGAT